MAVNTSRILIETFVRRALQNIQKDPERNTRNLIDMALDSSNGRFQKKFFSSAQRMLKNEHSAYYKLVHSIAWNVDHERLIKFGMNIGYNSCTLGARKIREIESREGFNVPWAMYLEVDDRLFTAHADEYDSLICQGKELGIFTWFIFGNGCGRELFDVLKKHDDCAFALMLDAKEMGDTVIDAVKALNHVLISVGYDAQIDTICRDLRERKMLYAVHMKYGKKEISEILSDNFLYDTQNLGAAFTVLLPESACTRSEQDQIYAYVLKKRADQEFPTVVWEMDRDTRGIDTIISEDGCSAGFRSDGSFFTFENAQQNSGYNLLTSPLKEILAQCLKK